MQGGLDDQGGEFRVTLLHVLGCTCAAHGFVIRHAPDCDAFTPDAALTREQVEVIADALLAMYDWQLAPLGRRHRLTQQKRAQVRRAVELAEALRGTGHREGGW
jgi:hypothetical protein